MLSKKLRRCSKCGRFMSKGYMLGSFYACSDKCRNAIYKMTNKAKNDEEAEIMYLKDCYMLTDEDIKGLSSKQIAEQFKDHEISGDAFWTQWFLFY